MKPFNERILEASIDHKSRLILALDLAPKGPKALVREALQLIELLGEEVVAVKLNQHLLLPLSLASVRSLVKKIHERGSLAIADLKLGDVASTNRIVIDHLSSCSIDAVIANPLPGYLGGIDALLEGARSKGLGVLMLLHMSNPGAKETFELKVTMEGRAKPLWEHLLARALDWGVDGLVVGATYPQILRKVEAKVRSVRGEGGGPLILSPGIGAQGGDPKEAVEAGADFLILGRSILEARNPLEVIRRIRRATWSWRPPSPSGSYERS